MEFKFIHSISGEEKKITLTRAFIRDSLRDELYEMISECDCQPVGETNVVECNCEDYLEDFELVEEN